MKNVQVEIVQRWPVKAYAGGAIVATLPDPSEATMRRAISRLFTMAFYCRDQGVSSRQRKGDMDEVPPIFFPDAE